MHAQLKGDVTYIIMSQAAHVISCHFISLNKLTGLQTLCLVEQLH